MFQKSRWIWVLKDLAACLLEVPRNFICGGTVKTIRIIAPLCLFSGSIEGFVQGIFIYQLIRSGFWFLDPVLEFSPLSEEGINLIINGFDQRMIRVTGRCHHPPIPLFGECLLLPVFNIVQLYTELVVFFICIPPYLVIVFGMLIVDFDKFVPEFVGPEELIHAFPWEGTHRYCPVFIDSRRECFCLSHQNDVAKIFRLWSINPNSKPNPQL